VRQALSLNSDLLDGMQNIVNFDRLRDIMADGESLEQIQDISNECQT
jgi:hypothetical protein